jgi:hypothetical protein
MSNRKKYNEKLRMIEVQRKRRLKKKLKRQKKLFNRKKDQENRARGEAAAKLAKAGGA